MAGRFLSLPIGIGDDETKNDLAKHVERLRRRLADAGSIPAGSTNTKTPTRLSWGFFSSVGAYCPVLLQVPAESCGPRPPHVLACSAPSSLSFGHFSLCPLRKGMARSPQDSPFVVNKINNLRVDESICLIPALVGGHKAQPAGCSQG